MINKQNQRHRGAIANAVLGLGSPSKACNGFESTAKMLKDGFVGCSLIDGDGGWGCRWVVERRLFA